MHKIVAIAISAMMLMVGVSAEDYCLKLYRPTTMELWQIKSGSVLCKIDTFDNKYSDTIKLKSANNTINLRFRDKVSSIEENWKNSCPSLGKVGVALYKPFSSGGIVLVFNGDNNKTAGSFEDSQNDGLGAYKRTTYYIKEGDIEVIGESNALIGSILTGIFILIFCIACSVKLHFTAGALFLATLVFSLTFTQGLLRFYHLAILLVNVGACCIFSSLLGGILWLKLSRKHATIAALIFTAVLAIFGFFAGYVLQLLFLLLTFILSAAFSIKTSEEKWLTNVGLACMLFSLNAAFNMVVMSIPAATYMEFSSKNGRYPNCTNVSAFAEILISFGFTVFLIILQIVLLIVNRNKVEQKPADVDVALAGDQYI